MNNSFYKKCMLCHRMCAIDRTAGERGFCKEGADMRIARAALHMWEEPIISGSRGSGAIFFSGCSLGCIYCQNREISHEGKGREISISELVNIMLSLEAKGAHNINFVTPTHFAPSIAEAIDTARANGLKIPTVYNTAAFETAETLDMLAGKIDIYLPDLKYYRTQLAARYSNAEKLPSVARHAIDIMLEQCGAPELDADGMLKRGVAVRLLLLPGALSDAKLNLSYLHKRYGDNIYISLMSQYTPMNGVPKPLDRRVTRDEYRELCNYAVSLGVRRAFTQDRESIGESFIPPFDFSGIN